MREAGNAENGTTPDPPEEAGVEDLAQAADRLFYAMRRSRAATVGHSAAGLSMSQLALLAPLAEGDGGDGQPVGQLAASAEISVPTATRMLQQLEGKGVVSRGRSPHDERQVLIRLTEEGAEDLAAMQAKLRARQYAALSHFTPQERRALTAQLHRLAGLIGEAGVAAAGSEANGG